MIHPFHHAHKGMRDARTILATKRLNPIAPPLPGKASDHGQVSELSGFNLVEIDEFGCSSASSRSQKPRHTGDGVRQLERFADFVYRPCSRTTKPRVGRHMKTTVRRLFERYESFFSQAIHGNVDMTELASLYASEFIGAGPAGVRAGKNDDQFKQALAQGYDHYRAIGTKEMRIRKIRLSSIDELHCVAHVAWTAIYSRKDQPDVSIDFDVHYLVQLSSGEPRVFGWVSGDEQELLKSHGVM